MKTIGIKLADGSFYPVLEDNIASEKKLELTTAHNNQTKVMVDLYRSATCSMEDAEYVDSLQIENLVARPNGETEIKFIVSLDENNQLSAKIIDPETGNESKTTITLVSRTLEERLVTDEYDINDSEEKNGAGAAVAAAAVGGGLLAAAAALRNKKEDDEVSVEETEETPETDFSVDTADETPIFEETAIDEPVVESTEEAPVETSEDTELPDMSFDLPDDTESETAGDETVVKSTEDTSLPDMDFDLPDDTASETATDETVIESNEDTTLPDMDFDLPDDTASETATDETISENTEDTDLPDMNFDLPDDTTSEETTESADFTETSDETIVDDETIASEDPIFEENSDNTIVADDDISNDIIEEDSGLPDMDFDLPDDTDSSDTTMQASSESDSLDDMDFDLPDDTSVTDNPELPDDFFNTEDTMKDPTFDSESPASAGLNFDGLYDEETERGTPSQNDEDDVKKKTKVPVIICIVCAIICIIATALILFIIPSKYNLINKKTTKETVAVVETPSPKPEPIPEPEPEPVVPEAKEDEIVIIEKAEEVVPAQPPVAVEKPKDIVYKIKWGDTLWDIADTYYKNPWRYKYIARYNGIKNPDYIISGTKIVIPAE